MPPDHHGSGKSCAHRQYRMTCEEFEELWERAGGRCELCQVAPEATAEYLATKARLDAARAVLKAARAASRAAR